METVKTAETVATHTLNSWNIFVYLRFGEFAPSYYFQSFRHSGRFQSYQQQSLVEVWDGDSWDRSHRFQTQSHRNPTRRCSTKLPLFVWQPLIWSYLLQPCWPDEAYPRSHSATTLRKDMTNGHYNTKETLRKDMANARSFPLSVFANYRRPLSPAVLLYPLMDRAHSLQSPLSAG